MVTHQFIVNRTMGCSCCLIMCWFAAMWLANQVADKAWSSFKSVLIGFPCCKGHDLFLFFRLHETRRLQAAVSVPAAALRTSSFSLGNAEKMLLGEKQGLIIKHGVVSPSVLNVAGDYVNAPQDVSECDRGFYEQEVMNPWLHSLSNSIYAISFTIRSWCSAFFCFPAPLCHPIFLLHRNRSLPESAAFNEKDATV